MTSFEIFKQSAKLGQQQTRWHKWFLLAITPLSFAYCAIFPFSPEHGPSLLHIIGFIPLGIIAVAWAWWKEGAPILQKIFSVFTQGSTPLIGALQSLQGRVEPLIEKNELQLRIFQKERQDFVAMRANCIKWKSIALRAGNRELINEIDELQGQLEGTIKELNELETKTISISKELREIQSEIGAKMITAQTMRSMERMVLALDKQAAHAEKARKSVASAYNNFQSSKIATA